MKTKIALLFTVLIILLPRDSQAVLTTTNSITVAIQGWRLGPITNEPIRFDDKLSWGPFNDLPGRVNLYFPIDKAYFMRMAMYGPDGKEVPKTKLGKGYGAKWDRLHSYKDTRLQPIPAEGSYKENLGQAAGQILPSPKDLFSMEKPGIYTLKVQIQLFRYAATTNTSEWNRNLLRFPPVKIKIEKPTIE